MRRLDSTWGGVVEVYVLVCVVLCTASVLLAAEDSTPSLTAELRQASLQELAAAAVERGDAERGESIFRREKLGCVKCHVASPAAVEKGLRSLGPGQRDVGDRLRPEQIVEGVLFPNKSIAKGYESFVVVTVDGKVRKGVPVRQSQQDLTSPGVHKRCGQTATCRWPSRNFLKIVC